MSDEVQDRTQASLRESEKLIRSGLEQAKSGLLGLQIVINRLTAERDAALEKLALIEKEKT